MHQKTFIFKPDEAARTRRRHSVDAAGQVLGRMATHIATLLRGKHKSVYTDFVDCGDFVTVTNAAKVVITGNKLEQKHYFRHSGYAKGAKVIPWKRQFEQDPRKVVYLSIKRMLPKNRLASRQLSRLRIYPGALVSRAPAPAKAS